MHSNESVNITPTSIRPRRRQPGPKRLVFIWTNHCDFCDETYENTSQLNIGPYTDHFGWQCCSQCKSHASKHRIAWQQKNHEFNLHHAVSKDQLVGIEVSIRRSSGAIEQWHFDLLRTARMVKGELGIPMISLDETMWRLTRVSSLEELNPQLSSVFQVIRDYDAGRNNDS